MYTFIKVVPIAAPLDEVVDENSPQQQGVRRETTLALAAPTLARQLERIVQSYEAGDPAVRFKVEIDAARYLLAQVVGVVGKRDTP